MDLNGILVECRILLQRTVSALPKLLELGRCDDDGDNEIPIGKASSLDDAISACNHVLSNFLEARRRLCLSPKANDPTPYVGGAEDEDGGDDGYDDEKLCAILSPSFTPDVDAYLEQTIRSEYDECKSNWIHTLDRHHRESRLHSGLAAKAGTKFRVVDQSFWSQVSAAASQERLLGIRRTTSTATVDSKVFDDSRTYRHLLKDFVEASALGRNVNGPTSGYPFSSGTAAAAATERLRRVAHKKDRIAGRRRKNDVDRKASKGRKIRYAIYPKLANFAFPIERPEPVVGEDIWFRGLFGGNLT